jgi:hypothetical protein
MVREPLTSPGPPNLIFPAKTRAAPRPGFACDLFSYGLRLQWSDRSNRDGEEPAI